MWFFCSFCNAQNKTELPTDKIEFETKNLITPHGPNNSDRKDKNLLPSKIKKQSRVCRLKLLY